MSAELLKLSGLQMRFGGLLAVNAASLAARAGCITALIGPNGAGKTTLFAIISGFLKAREGSIRYAGADITGEAPHRLARRGIARTFQIVQPFGAQTVRENIAVGAHLHLRERRAALRDAEEIAYRTNLQAQLDKPAADLTVCGRKRLELARALATRPRLLLLDEVLAGLNPSDIDEMIPVVRDIAASGVTVLMIEHVMRAVMSLAEHVWVLAQGKLIASGTPREVTTDPAVIEAYLGHGTAARLAAQTGGAQ